MIKIEYCAHCGSKVNNITIHSNNDYDYGFKKVLYGSTTYETKCDKCGIELQMLEKT